MNHHKTGYVAESQRNEEAEMTICEWLWSKEPDISTLMEFLSLY